MKPASGPNRTNIAVYVALMFLLATTYATARIDLGLFNLPVGLLIASMKALLVAFFFMHLRREKGFVRIVAMAGLVWLGFLLSLTHADFSTRDWMFFPGYWP